jgi:hypothetical protein
MESVRYCDGKKGMDFKRFFEIFKNRILKAEEVLDSPTEGLVFKPCPAKIVKNALYFRHQCYEKYGRNSTE